MPKRGPKMRVTITVDIATMEAIKKLKKIYNFNVSQIATEALKNHVSTLKKLTFDGFGKRGLDDLGF